MMKEMKKGVFAYGDESYDFDFKTSLSVSEKQAFVKSVVDSIIDDKSYDVVIKDLIFDFIIISMFTNIDTSFINMKDDDGDDVNPVVVIEHFLEETNVADIVKANMEDGLLDELNRAIDLNIQYLTGIHLNPFNEALASLLSTIEKKVANIDLGAMMNMAQKFSSMTEDFTIENAINAYMSSDVHKKNLAEIEDAKGE